MSHDDDSGKSWTLLTGHGHVLVEIARNPHARIRDISPVVGLTDRTVQAIVADLEAAGYLTRTRIGRRTRYTVNSDSPFRHKAQEGLRIGPVLDQLTAMADADTHPARKQPGNNGAGHAHSDSNPNLQIRRVLRSAPCPGRSQRQPVPIPLITWHRCAAVSVAVQPKSGQSHCKDSPGWLQVVLFRRIASEIGGNPWVSAVDATGRCIRVPCAMGTEVSRIPSASALNATARDPFVQWMVNTGMIKSNRGYKPTIASDGIRSARRLLESELSASLGSRYSGS